MHADRIGQREPDRRRRRARTPLRPAQHGEPVRDDRLGAAPRPHVRTGRWAAPSRLSSARDFGCVVSAAIPRSSGARSRLDGSARTVIGVVPRDFRFPYREQDFYIATVFPPEVLHSAATTRGTWRQAACRRPARSGACRDGRYCRGAGSRSAEHGSRCPVSVVPLRELLRSFRRADVHGAARRSRARPADRLRQRRQFAVGARDGPPERARDPQSARRGALAAYCASS